MASDSADRGTALGVGVVASAAAVGVGVAAGCAAAIAHLPIASSIGFAVSLLPAR